MSDFPLFGSTMPILLKIPRDSDVQPGEGIMIPPLPPVGKWIRLCGISISNVNGQLQVSYIRFLPLEKLTSSCSQRTWNLSRNFYL